MTMVGVVGRFLRAILVMALPGMGDMTVVVGAADLERSDALDLQASGRVFLVRTEAVHRHVRVDLRPRGCRPGFVQPQKTSRRP